MNYSFSVPDAQDVYNDKESLLDFIPGVSIPDQCKSGKDVFYSIPHAPCEKINKGDVLIEIIFYRTDNSYNRYREIGRHKVYSEQAGYVYSDFCFFDSVDSPILHSIDDLSHPIIIYPTIEDLIDEVFPIDYQFETDEFTSETIVHWRWSEEDERNHEFSCYCLTESFSLELTVEKNMPIMKIDFLPKRYHINRRDSLSFKFEDDSILHYPVLTAPISSNKSTRLKSVSLPLSASDIGKFSEYSWLKLRIDHNSGEPSTTVSNECREDYPKELSLAYFKKYAQRFLDLLQDLGLSVDHLPNQYGRGHESPFEQDEPCYVYLMVDLANGYHKIGISNRPDFRERTLQSEKPSIEKICAKKYPSRIIAQAIESALHTAFSSKRVRGEWFNLSEKEVAQIIATLS